MDNLSVNQAAPSFEVASNGIIKSHSEDWQIRCAGMPMTHLLNPQDAVQSTPGYSGFVFGRKSKAEQRGVHSGLIAVANLALAISVQDFCFYDGLRTEQEQASYVRQGTSRTMFSKHRKQADGFGHAMDLVPWASGKPVWDWDKIYPVAAAVDAAATHLKLADHIAWGGAWDRRLSDFGGLVTAYFDECKAYQTRHPGKDFIDGPHFEWRD